MGKEQLFGEEGLEGGKGYGVRCEPSYSRKVPMKSSRPQCKLPKLLLNAMRAQPSKARVQGGTLHCSNIMLRDQLPVF